MQHSAFGRLFKRGHSPCKKGGDGMKQTGAYQLNQWELTDRIRMEDFNSDNAKVDAALSALSGRVDAKAEQSALNTLSGRVDAKAEQSALNTLSGRVDTINSVVATKADQTALTNLENWVNSKDHYVKLLEGSVAEDANTVTLSLAGIDWSLWQEVVVSIYVNISNSQYILFANGSALGCTCYTQGSTRFDDCLLRTVANDHCIDIHLCSHRRPGRRVIMDILSENIHATGVWGSTYANLSYLNIQSAGDTPVLAGTNYTVWGVR